MAAAIATTSLAMPNRSDRSHATPANRGTISEHVSGEVVVKFRDAANSRTSRLAVLQTLRQRFGNDSVQEIHPFVTDESLALIKLRSDAWLSRSIELLESEPSVVFAEPNFRYHAIDVSSEARGNPNDPEFTKQWGLYNFGQPDSAGHSGVAGDDIQIVPLWQRGIVGKQNIRVAVIDTGIQWDHPDLAGNLFTNLGEIAGNGKDDDGNGFVDDVHGWNFVSGAGTNASTDDHGHGTHCAGVIGAVGGNGQGIVGVNWRVSLVPVKFLDASGGGSLEGAVNAINYARMMRVNVMSNSWGGTSGSEALRGAIQQAQQQGILFIAAAGNDSNDNDGESATFPATYDLPNIISVAATDNRDALAGFSNFGPKHVHVAAPGVNIYSTYKDGSYKSMSGTSMATPHVAGISALLLSEHPEWNYSVIKDRLIRTSTPVQLLRRKVMAKGRVSVYNALYGIVPPNPDPAESLWRSQDQLIESSHPYTSNFNQAWTVRIPGAKFIRVHFDVMDLEPGYDFVTVETPNGQVLDQISSTHSDYTSEYSRGDTLILRLKSDQTLERWGFRMDKVQFIMETRALR
jgi:subtilisin family serine protease